MKRLVAAVLATGVTTAAFAQQRAAQSMPPCDLRSAETVTAASAVDGRSFKLSDGREIMLTGIDAPSLQTADGQATRASLNALIAGRIVTIRQTENGADRYGRIAAFVFPDGDAANSVELVLLQAGLARVASRTGGLGCATALLAAEQEARTARRGLWADAANAPLSATDRAAILGAKGRFSLVEGDVVSVNEAGATIYVNFSRRWSQGLTVTILRRNQRLFSAAGLDPKALTGRRLRVRGVVEERSGPVIEAARPEQIEIAN
jgi:endonuclease YncB( thermonuclease family)